MKEWKMYQEMYNRLVREHTDDKALQVIRVEEELVENALFYLKERAPYAIYPAKSYMVGIIYATLLEKVYGESFFEVLDDPDLFCGQDEFFVPYSQDQETYDAILARLKGLPDFLVLGWAPQTVEYFYLECTQAGIDLINK